MANTQEYCKNCGTEFLSVDELYCTHCGQKRFTKLTLGHLFANALSSYFSLDSRLLRTFYPLLLRPGHIARTYSQGSQQRYLTPFQAFVFFSFFLFLVVNLLYVKNWDQWIVNEFSRQRTQFAEQTITDNTDDSSGSIVSLNYEIPDSLSDEEAIQLVATENEKLDSLLSIGKTNQEIYDELLADDIQHPIVRILVFAGLNIQRNKGKGVVAVIFSQATIAIISSLLLFWLILWLLFRKQGSAAEHLVHSTYIHVFAFALLSLLLLIHFFCPSLFWWQVALTLLLILYIINANKIVYRQGWPKILLKTTILLFVHMLSFLMIIFTLVLVLSVWQLSQ